MDSKSPIAQYNCIVELPKMRPVQGEDLDQSQNSFPVGFWDDLVNLVTTTITILEKRMYL